MIHITIAAGSYPVFLISPANRDFRFNLFYEIFYIMENKIKVLPACFQPHILLLKVHTHTFLPPAYVLQYPGFYPPPVGCPD